MLRHMYIEVHAANKLGPSSQKPKLILKLMLPIKFGYGNSKSRYTFLVVGYSLVN